MFKKVVIIFLLSVPALVSAQTKQYYIFAKTWNFLKYYHPDLATGKIDADSLFMAKIAGINSEQRPELIINILLSGLRKNPIKNLPEMAADEDLLVVNQKFDWYTKSGLSAEVVKSLKSIYFNRFTGKKHFYLTQAGWESDLPNERPYQFSKDEQVPLAYRLLAFGKIQGAVDYLYPYKYLMSKKHEDFSLTQLEQIVNCKTRREFEEVLARLISALQDTHSFRFYEQLGFKKEIFHSMHYPPFDYKVFSSYILVTGVISADACSKAGIKPGDRITHLNNNKLVDVLSDKRKLLSVSNQEVLIHRLSNYSANLIWNSDSIEQNLTIQSGHNQYQSTVKFISPDDKTQVAEINSYFQNKKVVKGNGFQENKDIAYFKVDRTYHLIENVSDKEIDSKMDRLMQDAASKKALVFDMRGYPDWGGFIHTYIYKYFGEKENFYHKIYFPNSDNIGTWVYQKESIHYYPDIKDKTTHKYRGQVFILVNSETLSASELYTMNLQHIFPSSVTIGQRTAGADGNIKTMNLPGGYKFSFTGLGVFYPNGTLTQKVGVKIDKHTRYDDHEVMSGVDKEMEIVRQLLH